MALSRAALALAAAATLAALVWLPFPPASPHEWGSFSIFTTLLLAQLVALAWPRRLLAGVIVYALGALGALASVIHGFALGTGHRGDAPTGFVAMVMVLGLALAAAAVLRMRARTATS